MLVTSDGVPKGEGFSFLLLAGFLLLSYRNVVKTHCSFLRGNLKELRKNEFSSTFFLLFFFDNNWKSNLIERKIFVSSTSIF